MSSREQLREALSQYVSDTFTYIKTVREFIHNHEEWKKDRENECKEMTEIKNKNRLDGFKKKIKNILPGQAERKENELQTELSNLLQQTLGGLQPQQDFLDAVEKLSVTLVQVFEPNSAVNMSEENLRKVQTIINDSKKISPLLLLFKRDNEAFFRPNVQNLVADERQNLVPPRNQNTLWNLEALHHQLDMYINNIKTICSYFSDSPLRVETPHIQLNKGVSEEDINKMLTRINKLQELREDEAFRTVFLFQGEHSIFMREYSEREAQMNEFKKEVEQCAKHLDNMKKGREISGVLNSVLGMSAGAVSISGLVLMPLMISFFLIKIGAIMAGVSAGFSVIILLVDGAYNSWQIKKVNNAFDKFKDDMNALQRSLRYTIYNSFISAGEDNTVVGGFRIGGKLVSLIKCVDAISDIASIISETPDEDKTLTAAVNFNQKWPTSCLL